ncbi:type II toxin-antitoxin system HicB family antitoxin [Hyphomicrobium sp. MC8b]|uniref:type II toxin-antitoxin system HicB family antitoxin n=1 Tax=Hyphomicrobium sp. MC8b TaxID=300273 RepID=UPI003918F774
MAFFVGIVDGKDDVWGVRVPDVRGCHGGGATADEAIQDAISALGEMAEEAQGITPRTQDEIARDPRVQFDAATESMVLLPIEKIAAGG